MKVSRAWLAEWVDVPAAWDSRELARRLTFAGFEVESIHPAAPAFDGVVVARIESAERHPQADKLQVCQVSIGGGSERLQIVCGAANARAGLVTALARVGATLPGDLKIKEAKLRGVASSGMLCSARELGLAETSEGIVELPADAPVGESLRQYLQLDDEILDIAITPNRGDAMSVLGIAREVAALAGVKLKRTVAFAAPTATLADTLKVELVAGSGAGRFASCVLRGIDNTAPSPQWLRERLRRAGVRSISPIVDVTNYVMLELGQPMHAYDLDKVSGGAASGLVARKARAGEPLVLLDGRQIELEPDVLVIADAAGAVGMAGVYGGERTGISTATRDVALEVAWFAPLAVAGRGRRFGVTTDAGQRFERGVDWCLQETALRRALELLLPLVSGRVGPIQVVEEPSVLPAPGSIRLRASRLARLLGAAVPDDTIEHSLRLLDMQVTRSAPAASAAADGTVWTVQPPSWRFDLHIEADLIEEVARLVGFEHFTEQVKAWPMVPGLAQDQRVDERTVLRTLAARGYQEIVSFGFVDPVAQTKLLGAASDITLANPIAADLAVMRRSLWPGLIKALGENLRRQSERVRLFECATVFTPDERVMIGGVIAGSRLPEQWGIAQEKADFFDLKADVQALLQLAGGVVDDVVFEAGTGLSFDTLHPGRSAVIRRGGAIIGRLGELHPQRYRELDLPAPVLLFELDFSLTFSRNRLIFKDISKFPRVRRDLSFTVPNSVSFAQVRDHASVAAGRLIQDIRLFDLYAAEGVASGRKSMAMGLILQDNSRTLTDGEVEAVVAKVVSALGTQLDARLRVAPDLAQ